MGMLALSAIVVLLWQPVDLFSAGFQLSFGVVALLLFAKPTAYWLWPPPVVPTQHQTVGRQVARWVVDYFAASVVAFGVALPMVAHHFAMVNPLSVLLSVLALPVVTVLLGLGYVKILLGVVLPSASLLVAGPLGWVTEAMLDLVTQAAHWPGAAIELAHPPGVMWVVAMLAVVFAVLMGRFARWRWALGVCVVVLCGWMWTVQQPAAVAAWWGGQRAGTVLRLNMFAVGDGSCYLVRVGDKALMFDCGSRAYLDVGEKSVVPALQRLGVRRLDVLFISHADLDHYVGVLAVVDAVTVGEVRVPPHLLRRAKAEPDSAVAYLVEQLRARGMVLRPTAQGWSRRLAGGATRRALAHGEFQGGAGERHIAGAVDPSGRPSRVIERRH